MADYFTHFSFVLSLPSRFAQAYAAELARQAEAIRGGDEMPESFPRPLADVLDDWCFDTEVEQAPRKWGLWLHSSNGGIDAVCAFIKHLMAKFDPDGCVGFEWSHDCSKPRTDAFGGGAAFITARKIKTMSTGEWLHKQAAAHARNPRKGGTR
jgi:hypothetical protein